MTNSNAGASQAMLTVNQSIATTFSLNAVENASFYPEPPAMVKLQPPPSPLAQG